MVFKRRFDTILALFICLIINANGSFDDSLHRLDVKQRSLWDIHNVDVETMKGAALYCQPTFCVSWNDTNGFALSFSSNRTAKHMFVDPIALSSEDRYRRCWKGQCAHFEARTHSLFITYGYADKQNPRKKQSISQTPTPSVMTRRLAANPMKGTPDEPPADEPLLPKERPGEKSEGMLKRTMSKIFSMGKKKDKTSAMSSASGTASMIKPESPSESESERKGEHFPFHPEAGDVDLKPIRHDRLTPEQAKHVIERQWDAALEEYKAMYGDGGKSKMEEELMEWKLQYFETGFSVFSKKTAKPIQEYTDVAIGMLTGPLDCLVEVTAKAVGREVKDIAMDYVDERYGITKWITSKGKKAWNYMKDAPERSMLLLRNGVRRVRGLSSEERVAEEEKRKQRFREDEERVSAHGTMKTHGIKTGFTTLKKAGTSAATGLLVGAVFGGPLFPLTAVIGAGAGVGYVLGKAAVKGFYIHIRVK